MKNFRLTFAVIAMFTLGVTMNTASASPRTKQGSSGNQSILVAAANIPPQPSLDDAVMLVQSQGSGRILSAREFLYQGIYIYEIKVMREGRVEVIRIRSSSSN